MTDKQSMSIVHAAPYACQERKSTLRENQKERAQEERNPERLEEKG